MASERADEDGPSVRAQLLGPVALLVGARPVAPPGERQRACLALLMLARGRPVAAEALADELWGARRPGRPQESLQMHMSRLRRMLADAGLGSRALVAENGGYALRLAGCSPDVDRFDALVREGRELLARGDDRAAAGRLEAALAIWRGGALADAGDGPAVSAERARLEAARTAAAADRADAELRLGRHAPLVADLERLCAEHPFEERVRGQLMLALYRSGRQADALATYRAGRERLVGELGLEPTAELRALNDAILRQDPALLPAPANGASGARGNGAAGRPRCGGPASASRRRWALAGAVFLAAVVAAGIGIALTRSPAGDPPVAGPNAVAVLGARSGRMLETIDGVARPDALAADGRFAWLADASRATITRVDLRRPRALLAIRVNAPTAVAASGGAVWVLSQSRSTVQEINADAGRVVRTLSVRPGSVALAAGAGAVWVAEAFDGTVARIDPARGRVVARVPVGGGPGAVAAGARAVWVADPAGGVVERIDPAANRVTAVIPTGSHPDALAVAAGDVWVADAMDSTLTRIDMATGAVSATMRSGGAAIAAGRRTVWIGGPSAGEVQRVDAARGTVADRVRVGSPVAALAVAGDRVLAATAESPAARRGGTLRVVGARGPLPATPADPHATFDQDAWQLQAMTSDGLLAERKADGAAGAEIVPDLAAAMPVVSDGGRTLTFRLRSGIRFSTGAPVRAGDVRASFARLARLRRIVPEARAFPALGLRAVTADDRAGTVVLRLRRASPDVLDLLASPPFSVLPAGTPALPLVRPPATGPYRVARASAGEIDLERNPYFTQWSAEAQPAGFPDRIVWRLRVAPAAGLRDVLAGRADVLASGAPVAAADRLTTRDPVLLHLDPSPGTEAFFLNVRRPPFDRLAVRQAAALAVDRRRLARDGGPAAAVPVTCQILPPGVPGYRPACPYTRDPGSAWSAPDLPRARALVRRAGASGARVLLAGATDRPGALPAARHFAAALRRIGLRPRIVARPVGAAPSARGYFGFVGAPGTRVQAGWTHWLVSAPDAAGFFAGPFTCSGRRAPPASGNLAGYCDSTTDAMIARAQRLARTDRAAAADAWARVDARVTRAAAWVPFAGHRLLDVVSRRAQGYAYNPTYSILLDQLSVR